MLLLASSTAAVKVLVAPEATPVVELVKTSLLAAPTVTEKVELSPLRPVLETVIVTEPAVWAVTVSEATPEEAVAGTGRASGRERGEIAEGAVAVKKKESTVVLLVVIALLWAAEAAGVKVWVAPEATPVVELVKTSLLAAPTVTEKVELSPLRPVLETVIVSEPAVWAVTVSEATPEEAVA